MASIGRRLALALALAPTLAFGAASAASAQAVEAMPPAAAAPFDPFLVSAVPVDVTANDTVSARERGLLQGRVAAFRRLMERLVARDTLATLPLPTPTEIVDMVQEFSIANERSSAVRYLADLNVKFNPIAVRSFLGARQVAFAELASQPLVVVTVLQADPFTPPVLWSDPDPWAAAWTRVLPRDGLVPFVLPLADIADFAALTVDQVLGRDAEALARFAARYQAGGVLIATAARTVESADAIQVSVTEVRNSGAVFDAMVPMAGLGAPSPDDALAAAAAAAAEQVEEAWKSRNMLQSGVGGDVVAMADVVQLSDWLDIKARLEQVPLVSRVEMQAMTRRRVQMAITHVGTVAQLQSAMALQALDLRDAGGLWTVMPARPKVVEQAPGVGLSDLATPEAAPPSALP
ncbi:MAG: DUF2066 domain-containing protein [Rhodospirillaceae bacterium]|nr:DUF2066 domain-containing protein [Rhodospirillaceae bacterium]